MLWQTKYEIRTYTSRKHKIEETEKNCICALYIKLDLKKYTEDLIFYGLQSQTNFQFLKYFTENN